MAQGFAFGVQGVGWMVEGGGWGVEGLRLEPADDIVEPQVQGLVFHQSG